ncbi:MAG: hypothetical protein V1793_17315 [Pseudomonadota bacterium]
MTTELERRINNIKATALMRAREYMSSVELVHWWDSFLESTRKVTRFEELDEKTQAQILEWEAHPYKIIGS